MKKNTIRQRLLSSADCQSAVSQVASLRQVNETEYPRNITSPPIGNRRHSRLPVCATLLVLASLAHSQPNSIDIYKEAGPGREKPIWVSMSGFSGEAAQVLQLDLYVQGFGFTNTENAQYLISGSNNGNLQGRVTDRINKS